MTRRTKTATLRDAASAAKERWPDHEIACRSHEKQSAGEERAALVAESESLRREATMLKAGLRDAHEATADKLAEAAQFVCDVNGDDPSIGQLKDALIEFLNVKHRADRIEEIDGRQKRICARTFPQRCELLHRRRGGLGWSQIMGDTWAEVIERIEGDQ